MPDIFVYLLLSLGSGAAYALLANGIVAMYKGSGILNFAQGGVALGPFRRLAKGAAHGARGGPPPSRRRFVRRRLVRRLPPKFAPK